METPIPLPTEKSPIIIPSPILQPTTMPLSQSFTEKYRFQGQGMSTTDLMSFEKGVVRIRWEFEGEKYISLFQAYFKKLGEQNLLNIVANTTQNGPGQTIRQVDKSDSYVMEVNALGKWTIIVEWKPE